MNYIFNFSRTIINWFHLHGRKNLPWQKNQTAYKTWISEIMLQQTQVQVVIPYFKKFIKKNPNIRDLTKNSLDEILFMWSGLGFYKRAKNIYLTSQIIKKKYNNQIPLNYYDLIKLPGIGKSTAGAILSLTFNYFFPILDGNVKRILKRFYHLKEKNSQLEKSLWRKINKLLPIHNAQKFNQAMMDLGKLICKKNPLCQKCPLEKKCLYTHEKNIHKKNINIKKKIKKCFFLLIKYKNFIYLKKQNHNIWKNLYYFPLFFKKKELLNWIKKKKITKKRKNIEKFFHHFNNYSLLIQAKIINLSKKNINQKKSIWFNLINPQKIGIPSPVIKIFKKITKK
ncbi:A/G-specific adenine glycosylase [Buchnera aphidicola]|uniref:A/G-specific adenine glycosylase n=1 Tax=Buchnera aphidicola TaxID=9 RepID=UPI003A695F8A